MEGTSFIDLKSAGATALDAPLMVLQIPLCIFDALSLLGEI